jgi:hypothetical protein
MRQKLSACLILKSIESNNILQKVIYRDAKMKFDKSIGNLRTEMTIREEKIIGEN